MRSIFSTLTSTNVSLKQKKICLSFIALSLGLLILFSADVFAVPSLGVATDGIYYGDSFEDYQAYFASGWALASDNGGNEGFSLGPSDSNLTIFTNILGIDYDIYLLTDFNAGGESSPISFGGDVLTEISYETKQADGYKPRPYYALNLGPVCSGFDSEGDCIANSGWSLLPEDPFEPFPFYAFTATIDYSGTIPFGSYFFAAADDDGNDFLYFNSKLGDVDPFSPKTTSTTAVPEPGTLILLGLGLVGVAAYYGRRKVSK